MHLDRPPNLTTGTAEIACGRPRFQDPDLQRLAQTSGALAAWRQLLRSGDPAQMAQVEGDFAVAVRDDRGRILFAVDRFGCRSLCYRQVGDSLRVALRADEIAGPDTPLDLQALFGYVHSHVVVSPRTVFAGVRRLAPAQMGVFDNGRLSIQPYWLPQFDERSSGSFIEAKEEFLALLEASTRSQLDGAGACFLSGGTDSSTVAGMIGRVSGTPARCYSIGFEAEGYDEMAYARIAARHFKCEHREHYVTPDELVETMPLVATHYDQPFGNSSAVPAFCCARVAAADGVTRLLAGDGGDELFGGNTRYAKQRVLGWYQQVPATLRSAWLEPMSRQSWPDRLPGLGKLASYVRQASVPMPSRMHTYNLLAHIGMREVLSKALLASVDTEEPEKQQHAVWEGLPPASLVNRMLAYDWRFTLGENDLPKVVQTAQLAGLDVGFPLLDDRLVAFSMRLPTADKLKGLRLRWFFKEALRGFLPDAILSKKKHGFGLPFGVWLMRHAGLQALSRDALDGLERRGIVEPAFVARLFSAHLPTHPGYYGEMVWILVMLELWLRARAPAFTLRG